MKSIGLPVLSLMLKLTDRTSFKKHFFIRDLTFKKLLFNTLLIFVAPLLIG